MKDNLKMLQDYANSTDNLWLLRKLMILEKEVEIEILNQKLTLIDKMAKERKAILN
jgi:hypothetical protein